MATPHDYAAAGLRRFDDARCEASAMDLGATVLSWRPVGRPEVLFRSREAAVGPGLETHGGIPICAPWFSWGRDGVPVAAQHGLVRWVPWRLVAQDDVEAGIRVVWELDQSDVAHLPGAGDYPGDLRYRQEVTFGETLVLSFTVASPTTGFVLDEAFHAYFLVDAPRTRILGLEGVPYRDHTLDPPARAVDEAALVPDRHVDRVYHSRGAVTIAAPTHVVEVRTSGAGSVVVWNPGPNVPDDFAADEWPGMVCVEVGNVQDRAVTVPAGGSHTMTMTLTVRDPLDA